MPTDKEPSLVAPTHAAGDRAERAAGDAAKRATGGIGRVVTASPPCTP